MVDVRNQAVSGLVPPQTDEALIRQRWASLTKHSGVAALARMLIHTIILAPFAWIILLPFFVLKIAPFFARRYTLTNRRLMIRAGWSGKPVQEVPLEKIDEVRVVTDGNTEFYRTATVEVISDGKTVMSLPGTPDPEPFRISILHACDAWVPGRTKRRPFIAAGEN